MSLKYEQLEFRFEDGELHAPVSALYKKFIFEVLKEKCVTKIFLEVRRNNHSAKALYEKLGFEYISVREKYYGGVEDALIMSKSISQ